MQANHYEKINKLVIQPMLEFYEMKINPAQVQAFVEDLGEFSEMTLKAAWKHVRQESKYPPKLAHFVEACREQKPKESGALPIYTRAKAEHNNEALAEKMMKSPVGQQALREGVGNAVWMMAWRDGKEATEKDVRYQKAQWLEATQRLVTLSPNAFMYPKIKSFYEAFVSREAELMQKYGSAA